MRLKLAIFIGKITAFLCRVTGRGGGTTLPGLIAQKIDPNLVEKLSSKILKGNIVITGTNGKTTTSKMIATILEEAGVSSIHNRAGSNLIRGIASTLILESDFCGRIKKDIGIFEVDEATVPEAVSTLKPRFIIITNFFRDQLDRYGELDTISGIAKKALELLPKTSKLILNANDPFVATLNENVENKTIYFGIEDENQVVKNEEHAADVKNCPKCGKPYTYKALFFSHIGKFTCPCGVSYPFPQIYASKIKLKGAQSSKIEISLPKNQKFSAKLRMPGIYNVYNALSAASLSYALGIDIKYIKNGLEKFSAAFGRVEEIKINGKTIMMFLVKNPTGFNAVIKTLSQDPGAKNFIMALNDNLADGTDVSWIWDVDFEELAKKPIHLIYASGVRAEDMALRLKYAGISTDKIMIEKDYNILIRKALAQTKDGRKIYLLPTYTAMLDIRKFLQKLTKLHHFWEDV